MWAGHFGQADCVIFRLAGFLDGRLFKINQWKRLVDLSSTFSTPLTLTMLDGKGA